MTSKKSVLFLMLSVSLVMFNVSCRQNKKILILGAGFPGDIVIVKSKSDTILNIEIEPEENKSSIRHFSKEIVVYSNTKEFTLTIIVDSNNTIVLDSSVIITKRNKKPFISLLNPHERKLSNRELFVGDEAKSLFPEY